MNYRLKAILAVIVLLVSVMLLASCDTANTPYDKYDGEGYTVSVKYDANGGSFTTNTTVIVDTVSIESLPTGADGMKKLPLIAPDDSVRGSGNSFTAKKSGYFLAGWYTGRELVVDDNGNALDIYGNVASESGNDPAYTYSGAWDFRNDRYSLDPNKTYSASEPVLTLYAAWVPEFSFDFYTEDGATLIDRVVFDPTKISSIKLPEWDAKTGKLNHNDVPALSGKTFESLSLSVGGAAYDGAKLDHTGEFHPDDASFRDQSMKIYVKYMDGEWFKISTAQQLAANASASGCYIIEADLDFTGVAWPSAFGGFFDGTIVGGGHKITGINVRQTSYKNHNGIFGQIAAGASITDLTIEGATLSIEKGMKFTGGNGTTFGLLAGNISADADVSGVSILSSKITVSPDCYFGADGSYYFGLVCGIGKDYVDIDASGITVEALESDKSQKEVTFEIVDGEVKITIRNKAS